MTFKDQLIDPQSEVFLDHLLDGDQIEGYLEDPILLRAILTLTPKQKEVVNFAYLKGLSDTEIATVLNKTQQAVSKVHKKALEKMGAFLRENTV
ncbi:sigma factor-like helix-turn-helix DNA-binding protein [Bacillus fonticola]|uniref:sigma factor-like helix-turn-helix DNA-binding protein n=1 Tax=Bacillus fonticola TaxID=2728853 RepID=UPI001D14AAEC|nr:sigma factor-like helix-turn-helix DNA-binding protein [Bacillus fonticola]